MKKIDRASLIPTIVMVAVLLLGLALVIWPDSILSVFPPLLGGVLVLVGGLVLAHCFVMWNRLAQPELQLLRAVVNIVIGIIFIVKHDFSLAFLSILFGIYILVMAGIDFSAALGAMWSGENWAVTLLDALFKLVLGILLMFAPFTGRSLWARVLGAYFAIASAKALIWLIKAEKKANKEQKNK